MNKELELQKSKRTALLFLAAAALVFMVTAFLPRSFAVDCIKAVSEAAMVGALADWFAVAALFRKVPIPLISAHTNIIPNNKDRIADNLARSSDVVARLGGDEFSMLLVECDYFD
eukprot:gene29277-33066_t